MRHFDGCSMKVNGKKGSWLLPLRAGSPAHQPLKRPIRSCADLGSEGRRLPRRLLRNAQPRLSCVSCQLVRAAGDQLVAELVCASSIEIAGLGVHGHGRGHGLAGSPPPPTGRPGRGRAHGCGGDTHSDDDAEEGACGGGCKLYRYTGTNRQSSESYFRDAHSTTWQTCCLVVIHSTVLLGSSRVHHETIYIGSYKIQGCSLVGERVQGVYSLTPTRPSSLVACPPMHSKNVAMQYMGCRFSAPPLA
eukprot:360964-Chlamydomonas_euryale.AAC.3